MTTNLYPITPPHVCPTCGSLTQAPEVFRIGVGGREYQVAAQGRIPGRWIRQRNERGEIDTVRTMPIPLLVIEERER